MRSVDGIAIKNASASSALLPLQGGKYQFAASATWNSGSVKVQQRGPDGSTLLDLPSAALTANGILYVDLPPGQFQLTVASATAVYAALTRVPAE